MNEEKPNLKYKNAKNWFKSSLLGFFVGLAVIVPGISGSTISIIFKLYDKIIYCLSNFFKKFKISFLFLLPILLGGLIGYIFGFFTIQKLIDLLPFALVCLFSGLMIGSTPIIKRETEGVNITPKYIVLLLFGILLPIFITLLPYLNNTSDSTFLDNFNWYSYLIMFFVGIILALTQLIPGLSSTAILMSLGIFQKLISSISISTWKVSPQWFGIYGTLIIGFLIGVFIFSKIISIVLNKFKTSSFIMILGFVIGSIVSMFINIEIVNVYQLRLTGQSTITGFANLPFYIDFPLGILLFFLGIIISYLIIKKNKIYN